MQKKLFETIHNLLNLLYQIIFYCVLIFLFVGDTISIVFVEAYKAIQRMFQACASAIRGVKSISSRIAHNFAASNIKNKKNFTTVKLNKNEVKKQEIKRKKTSIPAFSVSLTSFRSKVEYFILGIFFAFLAFAIYQGYAFVKSLPNPTLIGNINFPVSTQIYDRNGKLLFELFSDQDRTPVRLSDLPPYIIQATIAIEDKNFYNHKGISPLGGILRAVKETVSTGNLQGGSTITQQLIKTALLSPERTFERKAKEAVLALWAERIYTKSEIMQMYLNQVPYGGSAYGIESASKTYFNKSAKDLTLNEAATLAGLTQAPSKYSPFVNPELAKTRRNEVLQSMYQLGSITKEQYRNESLKEIDINPPSSFIRAPHFVFYVKSLLEERYGIRRVEEGGLRVITTLDLDIQEKAQKILIEELDKIQNLNVSNGAVIVTAPRTGEVLAMVGSRDYFQEPYGAYNVTTALRQPGSSIKPILYALGIESGKITSATVIQDAPVVYQSPGSRPYKPVNYDGRFHGSVPVRYALANSYNIPAVKTLDLLGVKNFVEHAHKMGIESWKSPDRYGLSLSLGGAEVKMTEMAEAFGVFANYGSKVELNPILTVEDYKGEVLEKFANTQRASERVLSAETSFIISDILSDNYARQSAFGPNSTLVIPNYTVAVKTGTTNSKRDNLTYGYTPKYLTGVWVGNNNNVPMNQALTSGITGAAPIWHKVMEYVLQKNISLSSQEEIPGEFSLPAGIVTKACYFNRVEYFKSGTDTSSICKDSILSPSPSISPSPKIESVTEIDSSIDRYDLP